MKILHYVLNQIALYNQNFLILHETIKNYINLVLKMVSKIFLILYTPKPKSPKKS